MTSEQSRLDKLWNVLESQESELHRRETSQGTEHDVAKMNKLRIEIAATNRRIKAATKRQAKSSMDETQTQCRGCGKAFVPMDSGRLTCCECIRNASQNQSFDAIHQRLAFGKG